MVSAVEMGFNYHCSDYHFNFYTMPSTSYEENVQSKAFEEFVIVQNAETDLYERLIGSVRECESLEYSENDYK